VVWPAKETVATGLRPVHTLHAPSRNFGAEGSDVAASTLVA